MQHKHAKLARGGRFESCRRYIAQRPLPPKAFGARLDLLECGVSADVELLGERLRFDALQAPQFPVSGNPAARLACKGLDGLGTRVGLGPEVEIPLTHETKWIEELVHVHAKNVCGPNEFVGTYASLP